MEHKEKTKRRDVQKEIDLKYGFMMDVHDKRFASVYILVGILRLI